MNNEEKIQSLNDRLDNINSIINNLSYGINNISWDFSKGTDSRNLELSNYNLKKQALIEELERIQDSGII